MAAQVVTITEPDMTYQEGKPIKKIKWVWKCTDAGAVADSTTATQVNKTTNRYTGEIIRLVTIPTDSPTDNYDVSIKDSDGYDALMGAGADRDTANTEQVLASSLGCIVDSQLSLIVAAAGNAKSGTVIIYIK